MRYLFAIVLFLSSIETLSGQARPVDDSSLRNAARSASDGDWLTYGLTPGEMRFSPLKMIDASNVKRLGLAWSYETGEGGGDQEATPLVWNNTIFGVTNWSIVCDRQRRGAGRQAETLQNFSCRVGRMNCGKNFQPAAATFTLKNVHLENAFSSTPAT